MKYADEIVKDMDARGSIKVPKDCFTSEESDYIRRRLAWLRRNAIYGYYGLHPNNPITKAEISAILEKGRLSGYKR